MQRLLELFQHKNAYAYARLNNATATFLRPNCWRLSTVLKWTAILSALIVLGFFAVCDLHLNIRIYLRDWISHADQGYYEPLAGCFNSFSEDHPYIRGSVEYSYELNPGIGLLDDHDCYDFAATIQPRDDMPHKDIIYHAYWRADLAPVGPKQEAVLRSFFATQNVTRSTLFLWSNGDLSKSPVIQQIKKHVGDRLQTLIYDPKELSVGSPMENSPHLDFNDSHGYLDGDLIRLLVIYRYGGMWFDMDALLIRDLTPLFEREWLLQWDCFQPNAFPFNGAFMHFNKESPYLCEMLSEMANGPLPRPGTIDWGGYMYYRIYRRLLNNGIKPWAVLPWCFMDSMVCAPSNSMPNAFEETEFPQDKLLQTFAYHWHNQWKKEPGTLFRFLDDRHKNKTGW
ncbi:hypothetical protein BCR43DRAFT_491368 [Syncephalastrum racemosum]|uniref:Nucleotide-diphospho-sugar transferase n=1 Tax=Syncephalastrum racemosum TaxID=13706 RepID=A0A1X2HBT5_SYNRA|nr:hypothetical protein BCR43DRAFT_491368 [Syncephalastrum racemosum]